ncbi:saccharopine dehydrogenase [Massilia cavernae]|uniref:Saccharopine dehydrogenase n=1 Tax=Massilia cavernae TaxID=2320864 RepID=A0A418XV96_9BURK|nr:saccharopine dehydrogenase [Massilia cavernae]
MLVLGGYGFFGARICQALATDPSIRLLIGGRDGNQAIRLAAQLGLDPGQALAIDANAAGLAERLSALQLATVIHTAGPFQGQDYRVAQAAIAAGANYIDLADGRDFVAGVGQLDDMARDAGVFVTSGASSLPALSSAVVDRYAPRFRELSSIRHGIASGARAPGLATMRGVFGYCGKPFERPAGGRTERTHGWLDLKRHHFRAPVGPRLLGSCDVPDLSLFPARYPTVKTVRFHAGFASIPGHLFVWAGAQLVRYRLLRSLAPLVAPLHAVSQWMEPFVSDKGAMFVALGGTGLDGQPLNLEWQLLAAQNHGTYIPCGAAIALARKLARGDKLPHGAMPCMGLVTVDEYLAALEGFDVREVPA